MTDRHPLIQGLLGFGPHSGAHRVALRAGLSIAVPLLVLFSIDHVEWSIYAAFGAFTSLYGRSSDYAGRLRMQSVAGGVLVASVIGGVLVGLSPARSWLVIPLAALLAAGSAALSDRQRWHPPGALFPIFAFTACASIPATPALLVPATVVSVFVAAFSVVLGAAGALRRGRSLTGARPEAHPIELRHVIRAAAGVLIAGTIATSIGIGHPYWAMVSAVVPLASREFVPQLVRGVQRIVGTVIGLALAALLLWWSPPTLVALVIVIVLQFAVELLVGRNYVLALLFITPLALLMVHLASPAPTAGLILDRGIETIIGVVVGVGIGYLTRPGTFRRR
jgi:hypothetical protein